MFTLNNYDRYIPKSISLTNKTQKATGTKTVLGERTNTPRKWSGTAGSASRKLMESVMRTKKASAVVSVTTASANVSTRPDVPEVLDISQRNCVPFPVLPMEIPLVLQPEAKIPQIPMMVLLGGATNVDWTLDIQTAPGLDLSKDEIHACIAQYSNICPTVAGKQQRNSSEGIRPVPRRRISSGVRPAGTTEVSATPSPAETPAPAQGKSSRKSGKKLASDVKFMIVLHKTLLWLSKSFEDSTFNTSVECTQDIVLAKRLQKSLDEHVQDPSLAPVFAETQTANTELDASPSDENNPPNGALSPSQAVAIAIFRRKGQTRRKTIIGPNGKPLSTPLRVKSRQIAARERRSPLSFEIDALEQTIQFP